MTADPYLVQRRLPGVQGQNGCWSDQGIVEATNAEDATLEVAQASGHRLDGGDWRACLAPKWEVFRPYEETEYVKTVTLR